jgi:pimeloyl-ACP methyl ester carboxylesterase
MPVAAINGIQINYADSGGDGPAVVLSHGLLMDASMFDAQASNVTHPGAVDAGIMNFLRELAG